MKFQKTLQKFMIIVIILKINTSFFVQCTVKKGLGVTIPPEIAAVKEITNSNLTSQNPNSIQNTTEINRSSKYDQIEDEMPDTVKTGFYILIIVGFIGLGFIIYKAFNLRLSRAERRYGVQGDRSAQELTPLPNAVDEDSENEDQTIFEINRP